MEGLIIGTLGTGLGTGLGILLAHYADAVIKSLESAFGIKILIRPFTVWNIFPPKL